MMLRSLLAAGLSAAVAAPAFAQDDGGRRVVLDFGQRIESQRNPDLAPGGNDRVTGAVTRLGLTLSNVTRSDSLVFTLGSSLRIQQDEDPTFGRLNAGLTYGRSGPSSSLDITTRYGRDEIDSLRPLDLLLLDTGEVVDIDEVDALLRETGTRETLSFSAALSFGTDAPLGGRLSVSASQLRYEGLSSAVDLQDSDSLRVGLDLRADLGPATFATLSLGHGWAEKAGEDRLFSSAVGASVTFDRPISSLTFGVTVTEAEAGTRVTLESGVTRELANGGSLAFSLGATRTSEDETVFSGSARYAVPLTPTTEIAASLQRSIADRSDGTEELRTLADIDLTQALSEVSSFSVSATAVDRRTPGDDNARFDAELSATYQHQLTEDWGLGLGVTRSFRDDDTAADTATSDTIFVSLSRQFEQRF